MPQLQKEVMVFKFMKIEMDTMMGRKANYDGTLSGLGTNQGTVKALASHVPSIRDASTAAMVVRASRDSLAHEAPTEDQQA